MIFLGVICSPDSDRISLISAEVSLKTLHFDIQQIFLETTLRSAINGSIGASIGLLTGTYLGAQCARIVPCRPIQIITATIMVPLVGITGAIMGFHLGLNLQN